MFCPNCKTEYRDGFTHCSDCGAELAEALPVSHAPEVEEDARLVRLWMGADPVFYSSLTAALKGSGIPYFDNPPVVHDNWLASRARSGMVEAVANFDIQVPDSHLDAAREILRSVPAPVVLEDGTPLPETEPEEEELEPTMPPTTLAEFLAWFVPMLSYYLFLTWWVMDPQAKWDPLSRLSLSIGNLFGWFGFFWMFYQVARYEKRPAKYIALAFIPFAFIWYWVRRYPFRIQIGRSPAVTR